MFFDNQENNLKISVKHYNGHSDTTNGQTKSQNLKGDKNSQKIGKQRGNRLKK